MAATGPAPAGGTDTILSVTDLRTWFDTEDGPIRSVDGVTFQIRRGETLALVGESGSGKSVTSLSLMRLIQTPPGRIAGGEMLFTDGQGRRRDLARLSEAEMRRIRGNDIAMVFQEPMTSLNPVYPIGDQIAEAVALHQGLGRRAAMDTAAQMLELVGIPAARRRLKDYPHQMSGGMRQRVMIAMALCCRPALLIADEPTTALDVTIQAQILDLMRRLQAEIGMSILFITHNLGVVAEMADRVAVMYGGRVVEEAGVVEIFKSPRHPYTIGLLNSVPHADYAALDRGESRRLEAIPGNVPSPRQLPPGCTFAPRCRHAVEACGSAVPPLADTGGGHMSRCLRWSDLA